ncbi:hypothetical protein FF021_20520, partial [Leptospira noguchii]
YEICERFAPIFLRRTHVNYIIKYLIFYIESAFCDKHLDIQFYRDGLETISKIFYFCLKWRTHVILNLC